MHLVVKTSEKSPVAFREIVARDVKQEPTRQHIEDHYIAAKLVENEWTCFGEASFEPTTKFVLASVRWLRTVASFVQMKRSEQEALVYSNWRELFVVTAAEFSFTFDEGEKSIPAY